MEKKSMKNFFSVQAVADPPKPRSFTVWLYFDGEQVDFATLTSVSTDKEISRLIDRWSLEHGISVEAKSELVLTIEQMRTRASRKRAEH